MKKLLIFIPIILIGCLYLTSREQKKEFSTADLLWGKVNSYRGNNLTVDDRLCSDAETRLREVAVEYNHIKFEERFEDYFKTYTNIGENLNDTVISTPIADDVMTSWLESPPHKALLDNPVYSSGCVRCDSRYCVLLVGTKKPY